MQRFKSNHARRVFTASATDIRHFNAVIQGVADHMGERILEFLHHAQVNFHVVANNRQARCFTACLGDVAHHAVELAKDRPERYHARLHDLLLQIH